MEKLMNQKFAQHQEDNFRIVIEFKFVIRQRVMQ